MVGHRRVGRAVVAALVATMAALHGLPAAAAEPIALSVEFVGDQVCRPMRGETASVRVRVGNPSATLLGSVALVPHLPAGFTATVVGDATAPLPALSSRLFTVRITTAPDVYGYPAAPLRFVAVAPGATGELAFSPYVVGPPEPPSAVVATPGDASATVTWRRGANGIVDKSDDYYYPYRALLYWVTASPGGARASVVLYREQPAVATVHGLTNGTAYTFTVTAFNDFGTSDSAPSAPVVPVGPPARVPGVTVDGDGTERTVSWTAPAANGAPLTGYTVTASPDGPTVQVPPDRTSAVVTGLADGAAYTFAVRATNAAGTGEDGRHPDPRPGAFTGTVSIENDGDTGVVVRVGNASAAGATAKGYFVTFQPRGLEETVSYGEAVFSVDVPDTTVTATVRAFNDAGWGPPSAPVVGRAVGTYTGTPGILNVVGRPDGSADFCFTGAWGRGHEVTSYVVVSDNGRQWEVPADRRAGTLTGLRDGELHEIGIYPRTALPGTPQYPAYEGRMSGEEPAPAPPYVAAEPQDGAAVVSWEPPPPWSASSSATYEVVASPGGATRYVRDTTTARLDGLANGTAYTFTVRAIDENGYGAARASEPVTPYGVPGPVTGLSAAPRPDVRSWVLLSWDPAPGGTPVTGYTIRMDGGFARRFPGTATSATFEGFEPGRCATFDVRAENASGVGPPATLTYCRPGESPAPTSDPTGSPEPTGSPDPSGSPDPTEPVVTTPPVSPSETPPPPDPAPAVPAPRAGAAVTLDETASVAYAVPDAVTYDVRYRVARYDGALGAYRYPGWWQETASTAVGVPARAGYSYCFGVRARGIDGLVSAWSPDECTAAPVDDAALAAGPGWTRGPHAAYHRGTYTKTATRGATLTIGARARRLALVATRCAACGDVGVYLDGVLLRRVRLAAPATAYQHVTVVDLGSVRTGTVTLRSLSGRAYVDGFAALRR